MIYKALLQRRACGNSKQRFLTDAVLDIEQTTKVHVFGGFHPELVTNQSQGGWEAPT